MLELAIARDALRRAIPDFPEGRLAKSARTSSRARAAPSSRAELGLGARLAAARRRRSRPRSSSGSPRTATCSAALLEAALGALFLEHGFEPIERRDRRRVLRPIEYALTTHVDHKTELQEVLARQGRQVTYAVLEAEGPPHDRHFTCAAHDRRRAARPRQRQDEEGRRAGGRRARRSTRLGRRGRAGARAAGDSGDAASSTGAVERSAADRAVRELRLASVRLGAAYCPRAPAGDQAARLQVVPRPGRGAPRAGRRRRRRAERLRQVERRRRDRLGRRLAHARASCAPRSPTTSSSPAPRTRRRPTSARSSCSSTTPDGAGPSSTTPSSRSRAACIAAARASTSSTGRAVRRLDLVELLADLGLGGGMHSIIGQGKVEAILALEAGGAARADRGGRRPRQVQARAATAPS